MNIFDEVKKKTEEDKKHSIASEKHIAIATAVACMISVIAVLFIRNGPLSVSCIFSESKMLELLWPSNASLVEQLSQTVHSAREKCDLIAARSTISAIFLLCLPFLLLKQIVSKDKFYVNGMMLPFIFLGFAAISTSFIPAYAGYSRYRLSLYSDVDVNIAKSSLNIIGFYFCIYVLTFRLSALIRSRIR
ncbi:hypothetical protein EV128_13432 [Rhizobium azibense]|nr:hypothetical protein EV128_13432 [Rhizobium azibense]